MFAKNNKAIRLTIDSDLQNVGLVGTAVKAMSMHVGLGESESGDVEMCVVEAINNTIKHACQNTRGCMINISLEANKEWLELQIEDSGLAMQQLKKPELSFDPDDLENLPEGGMGLFIIFNIMDEVTYRSLDGKNIFTMRKRLID